MDIKIEGKPLPHYELIAFSEVTEENANKMFTEPDHKLTAYIGLIHSLAKDKSVRDLPEAKRKTLLMYFDTMIADARKEFE